MELFFNANYYCIQFVRIFKCNFYSKTKFARDRPMIKDKVAEIEKIPCEVISAVNLV